MLPQEQHLIPLEIMQELPFAVNHQLQELPEIVQADFLKKYKKLSKSMTLTYFLHFFAPVHYLYLGKFLTQFLYWITFGGMGIWAIIDIFRIPDMVKRYNERIADRCLREVMYKHRRIIENHTPPQRTIQQAVLQPRNLDTELDPIRMDIGNLQIGYFLDFGLKTWEVRSETQYDWINGNSEKEFKIVCEAETQLLSIAYEPKITACFVGSPISMFSIQENLDQEILQRSTPPNILQYGDLKFYKENSKEGFLFKKVPNPQGIKTLAWEYLDSQRKFVLRIEQTGRNNFRTTLWQRIDPYTISDILPN